MAARTARRGSKEEQAAKRQIALKLVKSGKMTQNEIAEMLGVARGTVAGWSGVAKSSGDKALALKKRGRIQGTGRLLNKKEEQRIINIIRDKTPRQAKLEFYLWSIGAIMQLIHDRFGRQASESVVRKYLKIWGFTVQRPAYRYSSRDDVVIQAWLDEVYPQIAQVAKEENAEIHWLDECGVNNQASYIRRYSPKGKTPSGIKPAKREKISMLSTVTNRGKMRFRIFEGALNSTFLITFFQGLIKESAQKPYVIMDNLPVHKSKAVQEFLAANMGKIKVFYLPPYAPDLNPDEYLNNDLKQNVHKYSGLPTHKTQLKSNVLAYLRHIQKSPAKVRSYFQAPQTLYTA